jgi:MFS family permease
VLQGVGGGILIPLMATLPLQAAHGRITGRMIATVSLPMLIGPMLGPVIGRLILHWLSWRWLFWVNVPLVVVGFGEDRQGRPRCYGFGPRRNSLVNPSEPPRM